MITLKQMLFCTSVCVFLYFPLINPLVPSHRFFTLIRASSSRASFICAKCRGLIRTVGAVDQARGLASPEAKRLAESLYREINKFRIVTKGARRALKAVNQLGIAVEDLAGALFERGRGLVRAKREWLTLRDAGKKKRLILLRHKLDSDRCANLVAQHGISIAFE